MCYLSPRTFCYPSPKSKHPSMVGCARPPTWRATAQGGGHKGREEWAIEEMRRYTVDRPSSSRAITWRALWANTSPPSPPKGGTTVWRGPLYMHDSFFEHLMSRLIRTLDIFGPHLNSC